jgi:hypothetical protein
MRTNVTFQHSTDFVPVSDEDGVLATRGAGWFVDLLRMVPGLEVNDDLCQEDWGVVVFAERNRKSFWIGLSAWEDDGSWLAHFHHGSFAWLQRFSPSGKSELGRLLADVRAVLGREPAVSGISWHEEKAMRGPAPAAFATPLEG